MASSSSPPPPPPPPPLSLSLSSTGRSNRRRSSSDSDLTPSLLTQVPSHTESESQSSHTPSLDVFPTDLSVETESDGADTDTDTDSAVFDVDRAISSVSVTSSVYNFVEEHGRTYHRYKQGKYWMPNDEREQERLDLQHAIFSKVYGNRLALAPIREPSKVLDFGTGTGTWAIEFALQHPGSSVLGTDLSPIQPEFVPPNCRFEIDDIEDEWMFSEKFDYVHGRHMVGSITDFPGLFATVYENLQPGGWLEMQDYYVKLQSVDGTLEGTTLQRWSQMLNQALAFTGRSGLRTVKYRRWMREAGFEDVREEVFAVPGNPWAKGFEQKQLGAMQMENILEGIHGISISLFTKYLGMSSEAVQALLVEVRRDLVNTNIHFYYPIMSVYGRKPPNR